MNQNSVTDQILRLTDNGFNVYSKFIQESVKLGKPIKSPLREEGHPSFSLYTHRTRGDIWYKDFPESGKAFHGDCFNFIGSLFGISDFKEIIKVIKQQVLHVYDDDPVSLEAMSRKVSSPKKRVIEKTTFHPEPRNWNKKDLNYFHRFLIHQEALERFHWYPVKSFVKKKGDLIQEYFEEENDPIYFIEFPSGANKVYRPLTKNRFLKWMSNTVAERDVFGLDLITEKVEDVFMLAGNKDVVSFVCTTGIPAIALAAEGTNLSMQVELKLDTIAEHKHVLYDNDKTGYQNAEKLHNLHGYSYYNDLLNEMDPGINDYAQMVDQYRGKLPEFFGRLKHQMRTNKFLKTR